MALVPADLLIAVPTRGAVDWNTVRVLQDLRERHPGLAPIMYEPGRMSVSDTRNRIVVEFLKTDKRCLLMVDDDVIPDAAVLDALRHVKDAPGASGYDIVGCPYLMIRPPQMKVLTPCAFLFGEKGCLPLKDVFYLSGLQPCDAIGTGCMFIARHVLEDPRMRPFALGVDVDGCLTSTEDIRFCRAAKEHGYTIAADFDHVADHWQSFSFNWLHKGYMEVWTRTLERDRANRRVQDQPLVTLAR